MPTITQVTEISAPHDLVWRVLTDTRAFPEWNPFITRLEGRLEPGAVISVTIRPPGSKAQTFKPTVLAVEPGRRLSWRGRLWVPGIFDGTHTFSVEPITDTATRFTQTERFSGALVPILRGLLRKTEEGFAAMNTALATRAEQ